MYDTTIPKVFGNKFDNKESIVGKFDVAIGVCALCNCENAVVPKKHVILPTFPEKDLFLGDGFCVDCAYFIRESKFRKYSFVLCKEPVFIKHSEVWGILLKEYVPPYVISLKSKNFRRFNMLYCVTNNTVATRRTVTYDQILVTYDLQKERHVFDAVNVLYNKYKQPKEAIWKQNYFVGGITQEEYLEMMAVDKVLLSYRASFFLKMLIDYCQKEEEDGDK